MIVVVFLVTALLAALVAAFVPALLAALRGWPVRTQPSTKESSRNCGGFARKYDSTPPADLLPVWARRVPPFLHEEEWNKYVHFYYDLV